MNDEFVNDVLQDMLSYLDNGQAEQLRRVLKHNLSGYEIQRRTDSTAEDASTENTRLTDAFLSAKRIEGCSEKSLSYYRKTIETMFEKIGKGITHITTNDLRSYLTDYQTERKSSKVTIDNIRRIFSSFFAWLEEEDYIMKSPVRRIHKVKTGTQVKEVLTDENLEHLRDSCVEIRDLAIIDLLASTGMRVGELVKLNREDINFNERECIVFGKGNKERIVYFNARAKIHLQQYLSTRKDRNKALFVSLAKPHNRLEISGVETRLRKIGKQAKIVRVHPHKFRRTLATMAIDKGMPVEQVQRLLGHVKIDTTMHYAMVNQTNVKLSHRKYIN